MAELRIASPPGTLVTQHHSELGEEFVFLAQQLSTSYDCFSRRTAEYLNWRYIRNPLRRHIVLACWQEGELVGYAIVSQEDNGAGSIQEIVCLPQEGLWQWLALTAARFLRKAGSRVAYFWCSPCKSIPAPIRGAGFHLRDFAPVMVYHSGSAGESAKLIPQPTRWLLMNGDRDS